MGHLARNAKTIGLFVDVVTVLGTFFVSLWLCNDIMAHPIMVVGSQQYFQTEVVGFTSLAISLALFAEYPSRRNSGMLPELHVVLRTTTVALLLFTCMAFALKFVDISRLFMAIYFAALVVFMFLNRYLVRFALYLLRQSGWDTRTRIVVGSTENALRYLEEVAVDRRFGFRIIGYVANEGKEIGIPQLGIIRDVKRILSQHAPDGVVIALRITDPNIEMVIEACEQQGISIELLLDGLSSKITSSSVHHGKAVSRLVLSAIPHSPLSLLLKRITDIALSFVALLILSPVFLIVGIAIRLDDGGPVIFKQQRVGLRNRPFHIYKFRSMRVDAEQMKDSIAHLNEMSGPVFKLSDDPRVTRVGRFIRPTSIDEIPQFLNVLFGHMSLVGPRPPLPSEVNKYDVVHRRRLSVKPGIT